MAYRVDDGDIDAPQQADLDRFGDELDTCPKCRAKIYDDAEWCHKCGHVLGESQEHKVKPWVLITGMVLLASILLWLVL
jgi:predicted nucleic acid-binding Zn ribbon protein